MSTPLSGLLLSAPGANRFLDGVAEELVKGRSTLVLLPAGVDGPEVGGRVSGSLARRGLNVEEISADGDGPVEERVRAILRLDPRSPLDAALARQDQADVLRLEGLDRTPTGRRSEWMLFLDRWAEATHAAQTRGGNGCGLLLACSAEAILDFLPHEDVWLAVHWWWSAMSVLDVAWLCRVRHGASDAQGAWRESILASLAGPDAALADRLWEVDGDLEQLEADLTVWAREQGWTVDEAREAEKSQIGPWNCSTSPPGPLRWSWSRGYLHWSPEHGVELSSAALALLGRGPHLRHRIWRGQARMMLPWLDRIRLRLCDHLTEANGPDWPFRWEAPEFGAELEAVKASPYECQWNHMARLVLSRHPLKLDRKRWRAVAEVCRSVRNRLAHFRPVGYGDFEAIWRWSR